MAFCSAALFAAPWPIYCSVACPHNQTFPKPSISTEGETPWSYLGTETDLTLGCGRKRGDFTNHLITQAPSNMTPPRLPQRKLSTETNNQLCPPLASPHRALIPPLAWPQLNPLCLLCRKPSHLPCPGLKYLHFLT